MANKGLKCPKLVSFLLMGKNSGIGSLPKGCWNQSNWELIPGKRLLELVANSFLKGLLPQIQPLMWFKKSNNHSNAILIPKGI